MTVLDFYADWCAPCHMQDPVLDQVAQKYGLDVKKIDIETQPHEASLRGIQGLPTLVFVNAEGNELARTVGFTRKAELDRIVAKLVA